MLQHVGADHAVEPALRPLAVRRVARVVAAHLVHVPVFGHAVGHVHAVYHDALRPVLQPLAGAVVEDGPRLGGFDQALDAHDVREQALPGESLRRGNPQARLALDVHALVERDELAVARAGIGAAVLGHRLNFTA